MKITLTLTFLAFFLSLFLFESLAFAFEDTRVMPKGVRRVEYVNVNTSVSEKSDNSGKNLELATPLQADLKVSNMIKKRLGFEKTQLQGFVKTQDLSDTDTLGTFSADLKGQINVQALTFAYGLTDRMTLGFGVPFYSAKTSARMGFQQNSNSEKIVQALYKQGNIAKSREAASQLNSAASSFNETLVLNGYEPIGDWEDQGLGDVVVRGKYFLGDLRWTRMAMLFGLTLPTGKTDDPNILTDIPFGDGSFDQTLGLSVDQPFSDSIIVNEYATYTYQAAARREVRLVTDEEPIEGDVKEIGYKLGDKYELGTSINYTENLSGFVTGLGYQYHKKFGDRYASAAGDSLDKLNRDTDQSMKVGEFILGYSSINAFRRGEMAVPFAANLSYQRQIQSTNTPVTHRVQVDAKVFF